MHSTSITSLNLFSRKALLLPLLQPRCVCVCVCVCVCMCVHAHAHCMHIQLSWNIFVTSWTVTHQVPLSMAIPRQECWRGLPFPSPGVLLTQGLNPWLLHLLYCRWILLPLTHWVTQQFLNMPDMLPLQEFSIHWLRSLTVIVFFQNQLILPLHSTIVY